MHAQDDKLIIHEEKDSLKREYYLDCYGGWGQWVGNIITFKLRPAGQKGVSQSRILEAVFQANGTAWGQYLRWERPWPAEASKG